MSDPARIFAEHGYGFHQVAFPSRSTDRLFQKRICNEPDLFVNWWEYETDSRPYEVDICVYEGVPKSLTMEIFTFRADELSIWIPRIEALALKMRAAYTEAINAE